MSSSGLQQADDDVEHTNSLEIDIFCDYSNYVTYGITTDLYLSICRCPCDYLTI